MDSHLNSRNTFAYRANSELSPPLPGALLCKVQELMAWFTGAKQPGQAQLPDLLALRLGGPTATLGLLSVAGLWWGVGQNETTMLGLSVGLAIPGCPGNIPRTQSAWPRCLSPLLGALSRWLRKCTVNAGASSPSLCLSRARPAGPRQVLLEEELQEVVWGRSGRPGLGPAGVAGGLPSPAQECSE